MPNAPHDLMNYIRVAIGAWRDDTRDDADLLTQFVTNNDELAFRSIIWRHGPMVWRTCRRVLGDTPDAEDACQATFLALVRKAGKLRREPLAGWLHRVARQASLDARGSIQRRRGLEQRLKEETQLKATEDSGQAELYAVMDEELTRLPERLRVPLVLRYLEGKTLEEAAGILGCSRRDLGRRLTKGEFVLRQRLEQRGLALGLSLVAMLGNIANTPAMPAELLANTAKAAVAFRAGILNGKAAEGAEKLLRSLSFKGSLGKNWWLVLVCIGTFGVCGGGLVAWRMFGVNSDTIVPSISDACGTAPVSVTAHPHRERLNLYDDALPKGAIARIGTVRFRGVGEGSEDSLYSDRNSNLNAGVALSSDGKTLVLADGNSIYVWDAKTGCQLNKIAMKCKQVALSPDATLLAAHDLGTKGICVRLIDTATGQTIGEPLRGCGTAVFAPDGKTLACQCENSDGGSFYLYDVGTRKLLRKVGRELNSDGYIPTFARFSADGRTLACVYESDANGSRYSAVDLLDVKTGKNSSTLQPQQKTVRLAFTHEGNIVTGGRDKIIRIRDGKTGKELRELGAMDHVPTVLDFLPDGKTVLAACFGQIRFWDVTTGKESRHVLSCHGLLRPIILSADGTKLIEQVENAVSVWDVATGREIGPTASAPRATIKNLAFSPDGNFILTDAEKIGGITEPKQLILQQPGMAAFYLWNAFTGKPLGSLPVPANMKVTSWWEIVWTSRDTILAQGQCVCEGWPAVTAQDRLSRWKTTSLSNVAESKLLHNFIIADRGASFSPDGQVLANCRGELQLLDVTTGKKITNVPLSNKPIGFLHTVPKVLAFSADHRILAMQPCNGSELSPIITLWETSSGRELYRVRLPVSSSVQLHEKPVEDGLLGVSPDGRLLATFNPTSVAVTIWENVSGRARWHLSMPTGCIGEPGMAFSFDNRLLATVCSTGPKGESSIQVWDLTTGQECQCFHENRASHVLPSEIVFSPDGTRLASAVRDYSVLIWGVKQPSALEKVNQPLMREDLQVLKTALSGINASEAWRAISKLRLVPEQAVSLAVECLRPQIQSLEFKRISQSVCLLLDRLDNDNFSTRTKAAEELSKMLQAEIGEPVVQCVLVTALSEGKRSIEVTKAITKLLADLKEERKLEGAQSLELLRMLRSIELLELLHDDSAREVLKKVAMASPRPEVQREAKAALKRLAISPAAVSP